MKTHSRKNEAVEANELIESVITKMYKLDWMWSIFSVLQKQTCKNIWNIRSLKSMINSYLLTEFITAPRNDRVVNKAHTQLWKVSSRISSSSAMAKFSLVLYASLSEVVRFSSSTSRIEMVGGVTFWIEDAKRTVARLTLEFVTITMHDLSDLQRASEATLFEPQVERK